MNNLKLMALTFALLSSLAFNNLEAQINSLQIQGPREVEPGRLVRLVAATEPEETPFWLVLQPSDLEYLQVENGHELIFAAGCNEQRSIVVVLLAQQVLAGRIVTRQIKRTINVCKDCDRNAPDLPGDNDRADQPPITPPDWKTSPAFSAVEQSLPLVSTDARQQSGAIADNLDLIAERCRTGQIKELAEIWQQLSQLNLASVGNQASAWAPVGTALQLAFKKLALADVPSHRFHLQAAALAIRREALPADGANSSSTPKAEPSNFLNQNSLMQDPQHNFQQKASDQ